MRSIILRSAALAAAFMTAAAVLPADEEELFCAHFHEAADPARFLDITGANPDHFPKERQVDIEHIRLQMDFPGLETKTASVVETMIFTSPWEDISTVTFDALGLDITSIDRLTDDAFVILQSPVVKDFAEKDGLDFHAESETVTIALDPPVRKGERVALRIKYTIHDPKSGLFWIEPFDDDPDPRWEVWSQGESNYNRHWYVSHEYPNDRMTSEIIARVPQPNIVSAAGQLVSRTDNGDGTSTFHWRIEQNHVNYLTTLIIGQYDVQRDEWRGIPLEYYVPPQHAADVQRTFGPTREMMELFSTLLDEPYPFPRYAQLVVREFGSGGMENITATSLTTRVLNGAATEEFTTPCGRYSEALISHELAHTWFGNLITCRNWSHLWLNEGWASYMEDLWTESTCGRDEYDLTQWRLRRRVANDDPVESAQPVVFVRVPDSATMFRFNGQAVYNKGEFLAHALRRKLGDELFFKGIQTYIDLHKHSTVTTEDLRTALESVSGIDLEAWFRQWLYSPGTPRVRIALRYDMKARAAIVDVEQTQKIDAITPAFRMDMELYLRSRQGEAVTRTVEITDRKHTFSIPLEKPPMIFAPDPGAANLMGLELDAPFEVLRDTARQGPTMVARLNAVEALRKQGARAVETLSALAVNESEFFGIRAESVTSLGEISGDSARDALLRLAQELRNKPAKETDWRVRRAVAQALGKHKGDAIVAMLARYSEDPCEPVAANALASLGSFKDESAKDALVKGFARRGEHDVVANDALGALVKRRDPEAMDLAIKLTGSDVDYRVRPQSISRIGELLDGADIPTEGNAGTARLLELVDDKRPRARRAAVDALGRARFKGAVSRLEQLAAKADDSDLATAAKNALTSIREPKGTREDVTKLDERLNALETRLEKAERDAHRESPMPESRKKRRFLGIF